MAVRIALFCGSENKLLDLILLATFLRPRLRLVRTRINMKPFSSLIAHVVLLSICWLGLPSASLLTLPPENATGNFTKIVLNRGSTRGYEQRLVSDLSVKSDASLTAPAAAVNVR